MNFFVPSPVVVSFFWPAFQHRVSICFLSTAACFRPIRTYLSEIIINFRTFQTKTIFARDSKNFKLVRIVFIHEGYRHTHNTFVILWYFIRLVDIDGFVIIVSLIIIGIVCLVED